MGLYSRSAWLVFFFTLFLRTTAVFSQTADSSKDKIGINDSLNNRLEPGRVVVFEPNGLSTTDPSISPLFIKKGLYNSLEAFQKNRPAQGLEGFKIQKRNYFIRKEDSLQTAILLKADRRQRYNVFTNCFGFFDGERLFALDDGIAYPVYQVNGRFYYRSFKQGGAFGAVAAVGFGADMGPLSIGISSLVPLLKNKHPSRAGWIEINPETGDRNQVPKPDLQRH